MTRPVRNPAPGYHSAWEDAPVRDPRINHPPRLSDLYGDERRDALYARDRAARERYMDAFTEALPYPLSAERSEPLWHSIFAGMTLAAGVAILFFAWSALG